MAQQRERIFHPLLPRLKESDKKISNINEGGVWQERDADELERLSGGLDVVPVEFEINSIPDMWARPLLFEMALTDPPDPKNKIRGHVLHERVLGEWRGLLAMLALKERRGLNALSAGHVHIPTSFELADQQADAAKKSDGEKEEMPELGFLETLSRLAPRRTLAPDTTWNDLFVLLFGEEPIGVTSPITLVCTATQYYDRIHGVPWFNGRYLEDPTGYLPRKDREALASWLDHVKQALSDHQGMDRKRREWNMLVGLLDAFIKDLGSVPQPKYEISRSGLQINRGFFIHLRYPVQDEIGAESDVELVPSRKPAPVKKILVADPEIAREWRTDPRDIRVYGGITLDSIPFGGMAGKKNQLGGKTLKDAEVWEPADFFSDRLFVVNGEKAFPGTLTDNIRGSGDLKYQDQTVTPLIPINRNLLDYLMADDLADRIAFETTSDGVRVKLRLPLSGGQAVGGQRNQPRDHEINKEFLLNADQIIFLERAPVLEVWPNFVTRDVLASSPLRDGEENDAEIKDDIRSGGQEGLWRAYYTYFALAEAVETFVAQPYVPPGGTTTASQTFKTNRGEVERSITQTTFFPEAMLCEAQVYPAGSKKPQTVYAGTLLIKPPIFLKTERKTIRIGIDFGASGTHVYGRLDDRNPKQIVFENRLLHVTAVTEQRRAEGLYADFLPGSAESTPFLSIYQQFQSGNGSAKLRPLIDGHIFFLLEPTEYFAENSGIKTDLKWSREANRNISVQLFLEQLSLQIAAEAVNMRASKAGWAYSLPTAFSGSQREAFPQIWRQVVDACCELTGLSRVGLGLAADASATLEPSSREPVWLEYRTESEASALFFKEQLNANVSSGAVCIDIGSSTSDVAVWQRNEPKWQTSIRFAGRDIFLNALHANPQVLSLFGVGTGSLESARNHKPSFYAQADALLKTKGEEIFKHLPKYLDEPQVASFVQIIGLGLSGLLYYIGSVVQFLIREGKYKENIPNVYVGGNGSRMFHWLAAGAYTARSGVNGLFSQAFLRGARLDPNKTVSFTLSPLPKAEAACGLVVLKPRLTYEDSAEEGVLAGEAFVEKRTERKWDVLLTDKKLKAGVEPPARLAAVEDFVEVFNKYANSRGSVVSPLKVDAKVMEEVRKRLQTILQDFTYEDAADILIEPVFILALKCLLEKKTE